MTHALRIRDSAFANEKQIVNVAAVEFYAVSATGFTAEQLHPGQLN